MLKYNGARCEKEHAGTRIRSDASAILVAYQSAQHRCAGGSGIYEPWEQYEARLRGSVH